MPRCHLTKLLLAAKVKLDELSALPLRRCLLARAAARSHLTCELADRFHVKTAALGFQVGQEEHLLAILYALCLHALPMRRRLGALQVDHGGVDWDTQST